MDSIKKTSLRVAGILLGPLAAVFAFGCSEGDQFGLNKRFITISGQVTDSTTGQPQEGIWVEVRPESQTGVNLKTPGGATDSNGNYHIEIQFFRFTDYFVVVRDDRRLSAPTSGKDYDVIVPKPDATKDDIVAGVIAVKFSELPAVGSVSGSILLNNDADPEGDAALEGVAVVIDADHAATTAADGSFEIPELAAGDYVVTPSAEGYTFEPESATVNVPDGAPISFTATAGS